MAMEDHGFSLYSPKHNCYLATSFRGFPQNYGPRTNDTVRKELDLELEATCTSSVSRAASRLWIVDGKAKRPPYGYDAPLVPLWLSAGLKRLAQKFNRGFEITLAVYRLYKFRSNHSSLHHATPLFEVARTSASYAKLTHNEMLPMMALIVSGLRLLYRQRTCSAIAPSKEQGSKLQQPAARKRTASRPARRTTSSVAPDQSHCFSGLLYCTWHLLDVALVDRGHALTSRYPDFYASLCIFEIANEIFGSSSSAYAA